MEINKSSEKFVTVTLIDDSPFCKLSQRKQSNMYNNLMT